MRDRDETVAGRDHLHDGKGWDLIETMRRAKERGLFFAALTALLVFQFRDMLSPGHYLYLAVIDDWASLFSFFPWDILSAREIRAGHFPLWNPHSGTGMPLLANLQSSPLYPLDLALLGVDVLRHFNFSLVMHLLVAGLGTYFLARRLHLSIESSTLAAIGWSLSGFTMIHLPFGNHLTVVGASWSMDRPGASAGAHASPGRRVAGGSGGCRLVECGSSGRPRKATGGGGSPRGRTHRPQRSPQR